MIGPHDTVLIPKSKYDVGDVVDFVYEKFSNGFEIVDTGKIIKATWEGFGKSGMGYWVYDIVSFDANRPVPNQLPETVVMHRIEKLIIGPASDSDTAFYKISL